MNSYTRFIIQEDNSVNSLFMHLINFCAFVRLAYIVDDRRKGSFVHSFGTTCVPVSYWEYSDEQDGQGPCHLGAYGLVVTAPGGGGP